MSDINLENFFFVFLIVYSLVLLFFFKFSPKLFFLAYDKSDKLQYIKNEKNIPLVLGLFFAPILMVLDMNLTIILIIFFIIGYIDDLINLRVIIRFILTFLILLIFLYFNQEFTVNLKKIFTFNFNIFFIIFLTSILILGFIHVFNMVDGKDGHAIIYFLNISIWIYFKYNFDNNLILLIIFLLLFMFVLNLSKIAFLGNCGIIFLSLFFVILIIDLFNKEILDKSEIYALTCLPFFDGLRVTAIRIYNKTSPFLPSLNHIHHNFNNWFIGLSSISFMIFFLAILEFLIKIDAYYLILISIFIYCILFYFSKKI